MSHLDELTLLRHIDGELENPRLDEAEAHLRACAPCRGRRDGLARETHVIVAALREEEGELPASLRPAKQGELSWAFLLVSALAVSGFSTVYSRLIAPWWAELQGLGLGGDTVATTLFFRGLLWGGWSDMRQQIAQALTASAFVVLAVLALVATWWFGRRRLGTTLAALGLLFAALSTPTASAAEMKRNIEHYTLAEGQVVANDLVVFARTTTIAGTVEGDVIAFGQSLAVTGTVRGDVLAFCRTVRIEGRVEGSVRTGSQFFELRGTVGRNVTSAGEDLTVTKDARLAGSAMFFGSVVKLEGRVERDLTVGAGHPQISGHVGGNALVGAERLEILSGAEILGTTTYHGERTPVVQPEAKLARPIETHIRQRRPRHLSADYYWGQALRWGAAFVFGLVLILLTPGFVSDVVRTTRRYSVSLGLGAVALVATPILIVLVSLTLVGLAVGISAAMIYVLFIYGSQVVTGLLLGESVLGTPGTRGRTVACLALGLLLIRIALGIPYVWALAWFVIVALGLGAAVLTLYRRARPLPVAP